MCKSEPDDCEVECSFLVFVYCLNQTWDRLGHDRMVMDLQLPM